MGRREDFSVGVLNAVGIRQKIGNTSVLVLMKNASGKVLLCSGTTVPTGAGYAKGCIFIKTNASDGVRAIYENQGTETSASFKQAGSTTKADLGYKVVTVTVAAASSSGSSSADSELVGGEIIGFYPATNQDQFVDNVVLNANGSVTVTLAANATADNVFKVVVLKP